MTNLRLVGVVVLGACSGARPSRPAKPIVDAAAAQATQRTSPYDIDVPPGYEVTLVAEHLTFPTGVTFGEHGEIYLVEAGYAIGNKFTTARLVEIEPAGTLRELATGDGAPWNGVTFHDDALFVAQGGAVDGGRIVRYELRDGAVHRTRVLVDGLPSFGDHHTNGPVISPDGWVYFGQGTATNSAVVGLDNAEAGWLTRKPDFHDVSCTDVKLTGANWRTPKSVEGGELAIEWNKGRRLHRPWSAALVPHPPIDRDVTTGAYLPFGTPSTAGQFIAGSVPCSGAIMRVGARGGDVELIAWGFRNPVGLALDPVGALYATDNGFDSRGSRPVFGSADMLWRVDKGTWYGWPDYSEGRALTSSFYAESAAATRGFVLAEHPNTPPEPAAYFAARSTATGLDFSRSAAFGHVGWGFVALFGEVSQQPQVGLAIVRVDPRTGEIEYFARNRATTRREHRGFERPIAARFDRDGTALYVVDHGVVRITSHGPDAVAGTGKLWKITKVGAR